MSNTEQQTDAGNGEKKLPNGLKMLPPPSLTRREQIALSVFQSLLRHEPIKTRRPRAKILADEAFELADVFLAEAAAERTEK
jgi:hypothetical protein